jgi:hypothetical protein
MSEEKNPRRPWYQFSLGQLLLSITCFAIALGLFGPLGELRGWLPRIEYAAALLGFWAISASVGAGIGALIGRFWTGVLIGSSAVIPILFVLSVIDALMRRNGH